MVAALGDCRRARGGARVAPHGVHTPTAVYDVGSIRYVVAPQTFLTGVSLSPPHSPQHPPVVCCPVVVLPDHEVTMDSLKAMAQRVLEGQASLLPRILRIIDNSGIKSRRIVRSMEDSVVPSGFGHRNDLFIETSKRLGEEAAARALESANLDAKDIHLIITTSCTGIMIPSLDAHLITKMSFGPRTKRLPITELGCAAGTVAMSRAREFILAHPGQNVLIVAHELSSVTYQPADFNMAALIGALLFRRRCHGHRGARRRRRARTAVGRERELLV